MAWIIKQVFAIAAAFAIIYGGLVAVSFVLYPNAPGSILDTGASDATIYTTPTKYLYFGRTVLETPGPRVFIVGASNADAGLRPPQVQEDVSCASVNGVTIGNMNAEEMAQSVDLIAAQRPPSNEDTYVFGVWYGDFGDSSDRWHDTGRSLGETDVELELYRFGFYRHGQSGPEAAISEHWLAIEALALRPLHLFENVARHLTATLRERVFVRPLTLTLAEREARVFRPEEKTAALAYWRQQFGSNADVSDRQFAVFQEMLTRVLASGSRVMVVDLPVPSWHLKATPFAAGYERRLGALAARFQGDPHFRLVTMPDLGDDAAFSDEVHPRPSLAKLWAQRVGHSVSQLTCSPLQSARN